MDNIYIHKFKNGAILTDLKKSKDDNVCYYTYFEGVVVGDAKSVYATKRVMSSFDSLSLDMSYDSARSLVVRSFNSNMCEDIKMMELPIACNDKPVMFLCKSNGDPY